jgi:hypothetical protein
VRLPPDYYAVNAPKAVTDLVLTLRSAYWQREGKDEPTHVGALAAKMQNHSAATVRDLLLVLAKATWLELEWVTRFSFRFRWREFSRGRLTLALESYRRRKRGEGRTGRASAGPPLLSVVRASARCDDGAILPVVGTPNGTPNGAPNLTQTPEIIPVSPSYRSLIDQDQRISTNALPPLDYSKGGEQGREGGTNEISGSREELDQVLSAEALAGDRRELDAEMATETAPPSEAPAELSAPVATPDSGLLQRELASSLELVELAEVAAQKFRSELCPYIDPREALRQLVRVATELGGSAEKVERWIGRASRERGEYRGIYRGARQPLAVAVKRLLALEGERREREAKRRERAPTAPAESTAPAARERVSLRRPSTPEQLAVFLARLGALGAGGKGWDETAPQPRRSAPRMPQEARLAASPAAAVSKDQTSTDRAYESQGELEARANAERQRLLAWAKEHGESVAA